jgi:hypothetical protein
VKIPFSKAENWAETTDRCWAATTDFWKAVKMGFPKAENWAVTTDRCWAATTDFQKALSLVQMVDRCLAVKMGLLDARQPQIGKKRGC